PLLTILRPHPRPPLFPYTTLFRSAALRRTHASHPRQGRPPHGGRHLPREQLRARQQHQRRLSAFDDRNRRHSGLSVFSARRESADRKSTRLNSSHSQISYAVFCLK